MTHNPFDHYKDITDIKEIKIYKWEFPCWKCGKKTPRVSYSFYYRFDYSIGNIKKLDQLLLEEYTFIQETFSKTRGENVIANVCIHCGDLQGNWFIMEELMEIVYEFDMEKIIDKKLIVDLTENDLQNVGV